jgi:hypothetical protein
MLNLAGQTEARGDAADFDIAGDDNDASNFLDRERALLGDDADQFASENDRAATVEDGDDDLLGGDFSQANVGGQEMSGFESSFPAIDTTNDVSTVCFPDSSPRKDAIWHVRYTIAPSASWDRLTMEQPYSDATY